MENIPQNLNKSISNRVTKSAPDDCLKAEEIRLYHQTNQDIENLQVNLRKNSQCDYSSSQQYENIKELDPNFMVVNLDDSTHSKNKEIANPFIESISNDNIIFFFVNRYSGVKKGLTLLEMEVKKIQFSNKIKVTSYIFEINDDNGINILKDEISKNSIVKVIICAGDGSIFPFIKKLNDKSIDLNKIIFGTLPFGRFNDISRQFGYTDNINISPNMRQFKNIVKMLNNSSSTMVDIWEMKLTCDANNGEILSCNSNNNDYKQREVDETGKKITIFRQGFIGYVSLGYDGRIGFNADKKRSSCKCINSATFLWEKIKKGICRKSLNVNGFIEKFYAIDMCTNSSDVNNVSQITSKENEKKKIMIFTTTASSGFSIKKEKINIDDIDNENSQQNEINDDMENNNNQTLNKLKYKQIVLKGEPLGFVCQNIKYFFNGNQNNWNISKDYGIETYEPDICKKDKSAVEVNF